MPARALEGNRERQFELDGLQARPSEMTVYSGRGAVRPMNTRPMDPRDAD